jgi:hypothetical protein
VVTTRRFSLLACLLLAACLGSLPLVLDAQTQAPVRTATLPGRLTDQEFWRLISASSESNGSFRSDNLLSNEIRFQYVIPDLIAAAKPGRAFIGVGPEQNFTYIAAIRPAMAFIVDIRRGNLQLHLMYKALFELSADRAEFVARLFARRRPAGLRADSTVAEIFAAFKMVEPSEPYYRDNLKAVQSHLAVKHGFPLSEEDVAGVEFVASNFFKFGPGLQYSSSEGFGGGYEPTYLDLMVATDAMGRTHGYLADEASFALVKDLQSRNLIVPLVGDFAGPKAIRAVGRYLTERQGVVSAFYVSNVEQYLRLYRTWNAFCGNVRTLPLDEASIFVRAGRGGRVARGTSMMMSELVSMLEDTRSCAPNRP